MSDALSTVEVHLTVNGSDRSAVVDVRRTLVEMLREDLALTGTHVGCEHGVCGSCTVLIDGASARSCLTLAARVDGSTIVTIEGLGNGDQLGALQQACVERHSFQCGFCTPGILIVATELLVDNPNPSEAEVREAISGNLCRCTGYDSIVAGILHAGSNSAEREIDREIHR